MSKKLTLTVDPSRADPTKIRAILHTNPPPYTTCRRHPRALILVGVCLYEARIFSIPVNALAEISRITHHHYID